MNAPTHLSRGDLLRALGVIVIWGLNFVVMKIGLQSLSPMMLGALRFAAASLPFLLFVRCPPMPWRYIAAYGLAQGVGQFGLLFLGLHLGMTAGMASVVMQTQAFFTLIMAATVLGERARPTQWLGLVIAFGGLLMIAGAHGEGARQMTLAGFVLTLGAAFMWAVSNLVARRAAQAGAYEPFPFIVWSSLVPIVPFLLLSAWVDGTASMAQQLAGFDGRALFAVLFLALLATLLVPVVGLVAAMTFLGEVPTPLQWAGTATVLAGMVVNQSGGWRMLGRRQNATG